MMPAMIAIMMVSMSMATKRIATPSYGSAALLRGQIRKSEILCFGVDLSLMLECLTHADVEHGGGRPGFTVI
jgi:hypothetical protein